MVAQMSEAIRKMFEEFSRGLVGKVTIQREEEDPWCVSHHYASFSFLYNG